MSGTKGAFSLRPMTRPEPTLSPPTADQERTLRLVMLGLSGVMLAILLGVFPYQHWDFHVRSSIIGGILKKADQDSEWWFCLFAPPIVVWLVWRMKKSLIGLPVNGSWLGVPALALGMLFYWFGYKADTAYPGYIAGQFITLGLILLLGGVEWLKRLLFPWAFLVFTWPMIPLESVLALPLRMMTAQASGIVLNLIGVPVSTEGTGLHSAADQVRGLAQGDLFQLDVEEPCSGIRSLFSLLMLSALYGWLSLKTWPARGILFASAIPLAMLGNLVRMVLLALGSLWFGSDFAIGRKIGEHQEMSFYHSMAGFAVFGVALAGMFALCTLLEKKLESRPRRAASAATQQVSAPATRSWMQVGIAVLILGGGLGVCALTDGSYHVGQPGISLEMPSLLGPFVSTDHPMTSKEKDILPEGVRIERRFYTKSDRAILATMVLSGAEKRSLHSPDSCLPAQGWMVSSQSLITLPLEGQEVSATLMNMYHDIQDKEGRRSRIRALNIFWYLGSDGTTCAGYHEHVRKTYSDAFFKNLNHRWTLLTFFVPLQDSATGFDDPYAELTALKDAEAFIQMLVPKLLTEP